MLKAKLIPLKPNKSQEKQFWEFCSTARFVYNECLAYKISVYEKDGISLGVQNLIEHIQQLKSTEEYSWIKNTPEAVTKQAIKDLNKAFLNFYNRGNKGFPRFKSKKKTRPSFYQRTDRIRQIDNRHIKITGISDPVKCSPFVMPEKVVNTRVFFDGKYWFLSYSYEIKEIENNSTGEIVGVDLGINNLAITSNGIFYPNINKSEKIRKLIKKKKRLQRKLSKKYRINSNKTNNIIKLEKKTRLIDRKLRNIRNTYIHKVTSDLVKNKPGAIVIEDLSVSSMMKNGCLADYIQQQEFRKFRKYLEYKTKENGISLIVAERFYPSSRICSCCGELKNNLLLSDRVYKCNECGTTIDRDLNASINLKNYYKIVY